MTRYGKHYLLQEFNEIKNDDIDDSIYRLESVDKNLFRLVLLSNSPVPNKILLRELKSEGFIHYPKSGVYLGEKYGKIVSVFMDQEDGFLYAEIK